jgi:DNA primase
MAISDDIKARIDIVDVVADYVPDLKRTGKNYHARCPFHQENTPSFVVFPDRQTWRCFGACATGGDVFTFVMKVDGTEFPGALKTLAERAGVALPERRRDEGPRNPILDVNDAAMRFFRDALQSDRGSLARTYVDQRGMSEESVLRWGIGYAPSTGDDVLKRLEALGFAEDLLVNSGIATRSETGQVRDMFRGRLTFALRDPDSQIIGFAGRSLDGSNPKYLNTSQTPLFDKGRLLYGLDRARDAIGKEGTAVVVEGYMDVITAHEHGYQNVVASMGTALTEEQVTLLKARAPRIVLALDADAAGQEAMLRSLRTAWQLVGSELQSGRSRSVLQRGSDLDMLKVALITDGKDPDDLIRNDASSWRKLIAEAMPAIDFLLTAETNRLDISTAEGKARAVETLMPDIFQVSNFADQERYVQRLADLLRVPVATLEASVGRTKRLAPVRQRQTRNQADREATESVFRNAERDPLDEHLLALITHYPELLVRVQEVLVQQMARPENRAILSAIQATGTIEGAYTQLEGDLLEHLSLIAERELPPADRKQWGEDWMQCLRRLEVRYLQGLKAQEETALTRDEAESSDNEVEYKDFVNLSANERLRDAFMAGTGKP